MRKTWTQEKIDFIKENLSTMSVKELAKYFNVSYSAMTSIIHNNGLSAKKAHNISWSKDDDALLKKHFEYAPKNYLMNLFPLRTWTSILQRGNKTLQLRRETQDKFYINYNFFSTWSEYSAYFLGFILTDGHIAYKVPPRNCTYLQIELKSSDVDILEKLKKYTEFEGKIIYKPTARIQINNTKIVSDLIQLGVPEGNKTYIADFPKNIPNNMIRHCVRGIIDGDGWISFNSDRVFSIGLCGTKNMCEHVKQHLNIDCSKNIVRQKSENCWAFCIKGQKAMQIANWLYNDSNVFLERKYLKYLSAKGFLTTNSSQLAET